MKSKAVAWAALHCSSSWIEECATSLRFSLSGQSPKMEVFFQVNTNHKHSQARYNIHTNIAWWYPSRVIYTSRWAWKSGAIHRYKTNQIKHITLRCLVLIIIKIAQLHGKMYLCTKLRIFFFIYTILFYTKYCAMRGFPYQ